MFETAVKKGIMNCFPIRLSDHSQELALFGNQRPMTNPPIGLYLGSDRIVEYPDYPFLL